MQSRVARRVLVVAVTVVMGLIVGTISVFAARSPGYTSTSVDTQRRAAWVTSAKDSMVGLLNQQTAEVQSAVYLENPNVDLLQQNNTVVIVDSKQHNLRSVDTATAIASGKLVLPAKTSVALSESTVAVADEKTGNLWTVPTVGLGSGDLTTVAPNARTAPGAIVAVSGEVVFAAAPGGATLTSLPAGGDGRTQTQIATLPGGKLSAATAAVPDPVQLATVGSIPVVLDSIANRLVWGDKSITLPAGSKGAMLQQSGAASDVVLVATDSALLEITLSNAAIASQPIKNSGSAAQPVWVDGCASGAWDGSTPTYLSWCGTTVINRGIPKAGADGQLVFRVNGATVVLNDIASGDIWVLNSDLTWINNWAEIRAQDDNTANAVSGDQGAANKLTSARSDCTSGIAPPTPKDDAYGVRPGKPRVLDVLDNDVSSSCAISVISKVSAPQGSGVTATVVNDGKAIQLLLPPTDTAPVTLTYTVDDGAGHTATADVKITPVTDPKPIKPIKLRDSSTVVIVGGTVTSDVLTDWSSPSGDDLFLTGASSNNPDDRISYSPNGNITVVDAGTAGSAKKTISYTISDGVNAVPGKMTVEVLAAASAAPVASPVLATGIVGQPISIRPLDSVFWPGTDDLTLSKVAAQKSTPAGLAVQPHLQAGTVTVTGSQPGSYYLDYQAAAGDKVAKGVIRVVVTAPTAQTAPPVTMTKVAYLPTGGETLVDLTRDDTLATGGIIAVQQISAPEGSGLVVQLIDMQLAKISARRALPTGGLWVPYTVSAGGQSATGWLHVIEVAQPGQPLSPTASAISVSVRAGDAVTMPIAQHAVDPGGEALRPAPIQPGAIGAGQGLLFTTADSIRYIAPTTGPTAAGTTLHTQYTVLNTAGKSASAKLAITVVPRGANTAPQTPTQATARVFVGGTVDIPLSLDGIDPDGDWAIASDIDQAPNLGLASISGTSTIRYTAFGKAGSDQLSYTVTDPYGGTATGTVKVLVVPLPQIADPPVLSDLQATVAPGKSIAVDALAQATDPDGLAITYTAKPLQLASDSTGIDASVQNNIIVIKAGAKEGSYPIQVTVQNSLQRTATATLTVKVSKNAPKIPPTAQDVLVTDAMINAGKTAAVVDVSPYVANPGGLPADLKAVVPTVSAGRVTLTAVRSVSVPVTDQRQVLAYQVTNADSLSANAFLVVPSRSELNLPPLPKTGTQVTPQNTTKDPKAKTPAKKPEVFKPTVLKALVVDAGTTAEVKIGDYVGGAKVGRPVTLPASGADKATTGTLARKSASTLEWTVPADAGGGAALNVTVSDGVAKPAVVAVPAIIRPKKPAAPQFQGQQLQVEAGQQSAPVSLMSLVTYDKDKLANLKFSGPSGGGSGITASLSGGRLVVGAPVSTPKGTTTSFTVTVTDNLNQSATATFPVTVVGSTKPLAALDPKSVDTNAGVAVQSNVLAGASNPFGANKPLTVASVQHGTGYSATFSSSGTITVTPSAGTHGTINVPFVVADASGDPGRRVTGSLTVTVKDKPDAPGVPRMLQSGDKTATIQWTIPADNGSPIDHYTVQASGFSQQCSSSPCALHGLTNNVQYHFTVTAHNQVGDSTSSAPSAPVRPDTSPGAPAAPTLKFGDRQLAASWNKPANTGSPITGYLVQISPAPASGPSAVQTAALGHTFTGLENGTQYTVKVQALNAAANPGDWSPASSEIPAAKPDAPASVSVSSAAQSGSNDRIDISWPAPDGHGDAPKFTLKWTADTGGSGSIDVPAGKLNATIASVKLGAKYTISVTATNKAGTSAPTGAAPISPYTAPGQVTNLSSVATGTDNQVTLRWNAPADNGRPIQTYFYNDGVHGWKNTGSTGTTFNPPALTNGTKYSFEVHACSLGDNKSVNCGQDSAAAPATPYAPPAAPQNLTADADIAAGQLTLAWQPAAGNGRAIAGYQYAIAGSGTWVDAGNKTSVTVLGTNGTASTYVVRAYNAEKVGTDSVDSNQATATPYDTPAAPTALVVNPDGANNEVTFSWTDGAANGRPLTGYQYSTDNGGTWTAVAKGGKTTTQSSGATLANGTTYTFVVREITGAPARNTSAGSNSNNAQPYGPIGSPTIKASRSGNTAKFTWSFPSSGNGRPVSAQTVTINGTAVNAGAGSWSKDVGYSKTEKGVIQFCVSGPTQCTAASDSVTTPQPPPPPPPPANPVGTVGRLGAPTFKSTKDLSGDGSPNLPAGTRVGIKCWENVSLIPSDLGNGWFTLADGVAAGRVTAVNNFNNWPALRNQVPLC